mmetsp:Transcript_33676/g.72649  ORF Transcript_33676/g.72649 Transcript_33676/m.72649 type:complete len:256 (+) Transcript_33676:391-1158(+)
MDDVVAHMWLPAQPKLLPLVEKVATDRARMLLSRCCWICFAHNFFTKRLPREDRRFPLDAQPVDRTARQEVLVPHGHVKAIDHENAPERTAVEATPKLHLTNTHFQRVPMRSELRWSPTQPPLCLLGIANQVLLQGKFPGDTKAFLERLLTILRNNQVARNHECFLCKRTIMFVDQGLALDFFRSDSPSLQNLDASLFQILLDVLLSFFIIRMRFQHQKCMILVLGSRYGTHFLILVLGFRSSRKIAFPEYSSQC